MLGIEYKYGHFLQPTQPNKIQIAIKIGSRKKSWKKGRLCKLVSLWILISVNELIEKPVILSPQLISSAATKKQNALRINQINEFIEFLFLLLM